MRLHHVVAAQDFNRGMLQELFDQAHAMETVVAHGGSKLLDGTIMASHTVEGFSVDGLLRATHDSLVGRYGRLAEITRIEEHVLGEKSLVSEGV